MRRRDNERHVCPVWVGKILANPLREVFQNPYKLLSPYVKEGMRVLDLGCGMGFFSLPMAKMVGKSGRVICVDLQQGMIDELKKRASKAGLADSIEVRVCSKDSLKINDIVGDIDFALAFAVVHEVPDGKIFFEQVQKTLKSGAKVLLAEPRFQVSEKKFAEEVLTAAQSNFQVLGNVKVKGRAALLQKKKD